MRSKRKEAFRYVLPEEIEALFTINEVDGRPVSTASGKANIIDISAHGLRFKSSLDLPTNEERNIHLHVSFLLNEEELSYTGEVVWKKRRYPHYEYGMNLFTSDFDKKKLIETLKKYVKKNMQP